MTDRDATLMDFPPAGTSMARLLGSGWSLGVSISPSDRDEVVHVACGSNGENILQVEASTSREAWWRAVEMAAACGMLKGWPGPR